MNEKKVRRLIKSAVDISTNVLRAFCQKRLLSCPEENFQSFLTENLHYFFHQYEGENIRCCECTLFDCNNIKTIDLPKSVFLQAYAYIGDPYDGHVVIEKERIVQKCIHTYVTHDISLDDLETEALSVFLYHRGNLSPEEYGAVKLIQTGVQRLDDMKREQPWNIEIKLADLETAVISITYPHYYRKMVTELFGEICRLSKSKQEEPGIKKGKMLSQTKECSLNVEKWINDKENISLRSKSNEQNMQMLTKVLNSLTPTERHNQSPLDNVAEMNKILTESCAIEKKIRKLKLDVQYQKIVKNDKTGPNFELSSFDVKWNFNTPKGSGSKKIIKKLRSKMDEISTNLPLKIKDITGGSINILTTVQADVLVDNEKCNSVVNSFLGKIVNAGGFVTNRRHTIKVCAEIVHKDTTLSLSMSKTSVEVPFKVAEATKFAFEFGTNARENYPDIFMCDGFIVDCIVDRRLESKPSKHWQYDQNMYDVCKITNPFKIFLHQHQSVQNKSYTNKSLDEWFTNSIRLQEPGTLDINPGLDCRYLLSHFYQNNDDFKDVLHFFLKLAIDIQSYNCAKAFGWQLTRLFVKSFEKKQFYDVWPGFICVCKNKFEPLRDYTICSSIIVIVVEVYAVEDVFPQPNVFHGIPITYKVVNGKSLEANVLSEEIGQYQKVGDKLSTVKVSNEQADELFAAHSQLCLITKSPLRSKGYRLKKQTFVKEPCVQLFCRAKGIIPVGEKHFPTSIESMATDVLEGYPRLLVRKIKIGSQVGTSCAGTGSLGGLIKFHGEDAFLTCAHVVLGREFLGPNAKRSEIHDNPILVYCKNPDEQEEFQCGKLVNYVFPPELSEGSSVDAAIIKLDQNVDATDIKSHGLKSMYLNHNYIDYREIGTINELQISAIGAISSVQQRNDRICLLDKKQVEFETLSQAVKRKAIHYSTSEIMNDCNHFVERLLKDEGDEELKSPRTVTLHQQISMRNVSFTQGDSGMCIYVKCGDTDYRCLGMAIASHPDGGCIITPIKAILSAFKLI